MRSDDHGRAAGDPIQREQALQRWKADLRLTNDLARLLRQLCHSLPELWVINIDIARQLSIDLPHRSEYPGCIPGDKTFYDLDDPDERALWNTHSSRPQAWKKREVGWPAFLDRLQNLTVGCWRSAHDGWDLATRLPQAIAAKLNDPSQKDFAMRLIHALKDVESQLGNIVPYHTVFRECSEDGVIPAQALYRSLEVFLRREKAKLSSFQKVAADFERDDENEFWNTEAPKLFGYGFLNARDVIHEFIEPLDDAATLYERARPIAPIIPLTTELRNFSQRDLDLLRSLIRGFIDACDRCSDAIKKNHGLDWPDVRRSWNDAREKLQQVWRLLGSGDLACFLTDSSQLRDALGKTIEFVEETMTTPFSRDADYYGDNALNYLGLGMQLARLQVLNSFPDRIETDRDNAATQKISGEQAAVTKDAPLDAAASSGEPAAGEVVGRGARHPAEQRLRAIATNVKRGSKWTKDDARAALEQMQQAEPRYFDLLSTRDLARIAGGSPHTWLNSGGPLPEAVQRNRSGREAPRHREAVSLTDAVLAQAPSDSQTPLDELIERESPDAADAERERQAEIERLAREQADDDTDFIRSTL